MIYDVEVRDAGKKGKGVFALRDFKKGQFIFASRRGKMITKKDFSTLTPDDMRHLNEVDADTFEIMRSPGRFINHSCDPNTMPKGTFLYAWKDIKKGDEITTDYRVDGNFHNKWKCYCGSKNCKGWVISDFFTLDKEKQKMYLPYAPQFIQMKYKKLGKRKTY